MENDKGLIGFLQKKSLFSSDALKNAGKKRSNTINSNGKDSIIKKITEKDLRNSMSKQRHDPVHNNSRTSQNSNEQIYIETGSSQNLHTVTQYAKSRFVQQSIPITKQINRSIESLYKTKQQALKNSVNRTFQTPQNVKSNAKQAVAAKTSNFFSNTLTKSREQEEVNISNNSNSKEKPIKFWQRTRANGFQSARSESAQCLQNLSFKIKVQLSNLNHKIEQFRTNLFDFLHNQVNSLRENILSLVEQTFKQSSKYIEEYMTMEQKRLAGDLFRIKEKLESFYLKIEYMKVQINKPQWRRVAGEILSTELEDNIQTMIKQSSDKEVDIWEKRSFGKQKVKNIAKQLKQLIRLKE